MLCPRISRCCAWRLEVVEGAPNAQDLTAEQINHRTLTGRVPKLQRQPNKPFLHECASS